MKTELKNLITTILGLVLWACIIPMIFIMLLNPNADKAILIPAAGVFLVVGTFAIYFKNLDAQAMLKRTLDKFKK